MASPADQGRRSAERLASNGFRLTPQRRQVYSLLLEHRDHPTANEVFLRAKQELPDISMATVYNCLDALVQCGLVRQVNVDRSATRYCPNMHEHSHFYCDGCGRIFDVDYCPTATKAGRQLPAGFRASHFEVSIRGICADCATPAKAGRKSGPVSKLVPAGA